MEIGIKIKELRLKNGLTQEELASRCELTKGYISQLENDLTSPSITTLTDILTSLGTSLKDFFTDDDEQVVFGEEDYFVKKDDTGEIVWLIPTSQKNAMEPIMFTLNPSMTYSDLPHEGEEFGYVLDGEIIVGVGKREFKAKGGESFRYRSDKSHYIKNTGKKKAKILWVSCPPNF